MLLQLPTKKQVKIVVQYENGVRMVMRTPFSVI